MAQFVMSTDVEPVTVQAFGNWFSFKPGQIKAMNPNLVDFLAMDKKELGFVSLPDAVGEDPTSAESIEAKNVALEQGRANIVEHVTGLIRNIEVHMAAAYERSKETMPADVRAGTLPHYRKLTALKALNADRNQLALDEIAKLKGQLNGDANSSDALSANKGSANLPKSAGPQK